MDALRILHVAPYFENAWAYGGIPRVVAAQAHALAAAGHHVTVATTDARDSGTRTSPAGGGASSRLAPRVEQTADGIEVRVFPNLSNAAAYRWQFFVPLGLTRFLRANARQFDVAHLHACHNLLTAKAAKHLRDAGVLYVVQPNGTARRIERRRAAKWIFDALFERGVLTNAAFVLAVTDWERRQLQELVNPGSKDPGLHQRDELSRRRGEDPGLHGPFDRGGLKPPGYEDAEDPGLHQAGRIRLVPNPLAPMPSCPLPGRGGFRSRHNLTDAPLLMYFGMLSPRKQPDVLARATAALNRPDVQLVFAGNDMGAGRRTRDAVRTLGLDPRTRFTGLLTGPSRYQALADADIVVYPSHDEAFGLVPLEALQSGTPVIVSDDGGCGELIGAVGGGMLVAPGDPRALAWAIGTMLDDLPGWRAKAEAAGIEASRRFHPDHVAARLEEVYREAIGKS